MSGAMCAGIGLLCGRREILKHGGIPYTKNFMREKLWHGNFMHENSMHENSIHENFIHENKIHMDENSTKCWVVFLNFHLA